MEEIGVFHVNKKEMDSKKALVDLDLRLGIAIKRLRENKGLTQSELAAKADVTQACISLTENEHRNQGNTRVNLKMLQRIAQALSQGRLSDLIRFAESVPSPKDVVAKVEEFISEVED